MMKVLRKKRKGGFTLIELIVVIAILGILAAIAVPRLIGVTDGADDAALAASVRTLNGAVAVYLAEAGNEIADFATMNAGAAVDLLEGAGVLQANTSTTGITFTPATATFSITTP